MPTVSDHIRRLRGEAGMSQYALADALGVSRSLVAQWERGATPSVGRLLELARALDVDPHALLRGVTPADCTPSGPDGTPVALCETQGMDRQ